MNKRIIFLIMFAGLFGLAGLASAAVVIPNPLGATENFDQLLFKIATAVGLLIASLGTMMLIVAGIFYVTSAGSPERVNKAKAALTYAIVGIAIGLAATGIVALIKQIIGVV